MDPAPSLHRASPGPTEQVKGVDHDSLNADGREILARHAAHAGARRIRQEGRDRERSPPRGERLRHPRCARDGT